MKLTPEEILNNWHTHGALWLMEDPQLFENHADAFVDAIKACSGAPHHQELLKDMAGGSPPFAAAVAGNPNTPVYLLEKLSLHSKSTVREGVASNPATLPERILVRLTTDKFWMVRKTIAARKDNAAVQVALSIDVNGDVREELAKNKTLPAILLEKLAKDCFVWVRHAVAENPSTSAALLAQLAQDKYELVAEIAAAKLKRIGMTEKEEAEYNLSLYLNL